MTVKSILVLPVPAGSVMLLSAIDMVVAGATVLQGYNSGTKRARGVWRLESSRSGIEPKSAKDIGRHVIISSAR